MRRVSSVLQARAAFLGIAAREAASPARKVVEALTLGVGATVVSVVAFASNQPAWGAFVLALTAVLVLWEGAYRLRRREHAEHAKELNEQRDARATALRRVAELEASPANDPEAFIRAFSAWLRSKRAALPVRPEIRLTSTSVLYDRDAMAKVQAEHSAALTRHKQAFEEVERQTRIEYHERFRAGAASVLGRVHADLVSEPKSIRDFEEIRTLLENRRPGAAERARAKGEAFIRAGERLRGRLDDVTSDEVLLMLVEDIQTWRADVWRWANVQRGRSGSFKLLQAFTERPDTRHLKQHSGIENIRLYLGGTLSALERYDPEGDQ